MRNGFVFIFVLLLFYLLSISMADLYSQNIRLERVEPDPKQPWRIYLDITDSQNQQQSDLRPQQFEVRIGDVWTGNPVKVEPFHKARESMAIAIIIDTSLSMKDEPIKKAKRALNEFLDSRNPEDKVALVMFNDDVVQLVGFTNNHQALRKKVSLLEVGGKSSVLNKAMFKTLDLFEDTSLPTRKVLIVLSDGRDEGQAYEDQDVIEKARRLKVPLYALGFARSNSPYFDHMERFADFTGGLFYRANSIADLQPIFTRIEHYLEEQWVLHLPPNIGISQNKIQKITVSVHSLGNTLTAEYELVLPDGWQFQTPEEPLPPQVGWQKYLLLIGGLVLILVAICSCLVFLVYKRRQEELEADANLGKFVPPGVRQFPKPDPTAPVNFLIIENNLQSGSFPIVNNEIWIGGNEGCDLVLQDSRVSNYHAMVKWEDGHFILIDNHSTNGTLIDNRSLKNAPMILAAGNCIQMGATKLYFQGIQNTQVN